MRHYDVEQIRKRVAKILQGDPSEREHLLVALISTISDTCYDVGMRSVQQDIIKALDLHILL